MKHVFLSLFFLVLASLSLPALGMYSREKLWFDALDRGDQQTMAELIGQGIDVNVRNDYAMKADIKAMYGDFGTTALIESVRKGDVALVQFLLKNGANPNIRNSMGFTALTMAALQGHDLLTQLLLEHGASQDIKDLSGNTPLIIASGSGHIKVVQQLLMHEQESTTQSIIDIVDMQNVYRSTALLEATRNHHAHIALMLLEHCANPDTGNHQGLTPLMVAAGNGSLPVVIRLLECDACPDAQDKQGNTALIKAIERNQSQVVPLLLACSDEAHLALRNKKGQTALDVAQARKRNHIAQLLETTHA